MGWWNQSSPGRSYTPAQTMLSLAALSGVLWLFVLCLTRSVDVATLVAVIGFVLAGSFVLWGEMYLRRPPGDD